MSAPVPSSEPRFTATAVASSEGSGTTVFRSASATSPVSEADAFAKAKEAAKIRADAAASGQPRLTGLDRYPYPERVLVEPILDRLTLPIELDPAGEIGRVTRNGYDATVLNAYRVLFVDVDTTTDSSNAPSEHVVDRTVALAALQAECEKRPDLAFRVYETRAGLRYLCTSHLFNPTADETLALLHRLKADQRYTTLCRVQKCFRARLTPKPWRCTAAPQPKASSWLGRLKQSVSAAPAANLTDFATCRYVKTWGNSPSALIPAIELVLGVHDRISEALSAKPLA